MTATHQFQIGDTVSIKGKPYKVDGTTASGTHYWVLAEEHGGDGYYSELWDFSGSRPTLVKAPWRDRR